MKTVTSSPSAPRCPAALARAERAKKRWPTFGKLTGYLASLRKHGEPLPETEVASVEVQAA